VNRIIVEGNLGKAPEVGPAKSGMMLARFSIADTYRKNKEDTSGVTTWFNCVAFDRVAEGCAALVKGQRIIVEGRLQEEEYTNKDGQQVKVIKLIANNVSVSVVARGPSGGTVAPVEAGPVKADDDFVIPF
jgi:single-strand DNA-binding protein